MYKMDTTIIALLWIVLFIFIVVVTFIIIYYTTKSSNDIPFPSAKNISLLNQTGYSLASLSIFDSLGNSYTIPSTYVWSDNTEIIIKVATIPQYGSLQLFANSVDSDNEIIDETNIHIVNIDNTMKVLYLFDTDPASIISNVTNKSPTFSYSMTFTSMKYNTTGVSLLQNGDTFPTSLQLYNNTSSATTITSIYITDSQGNEYVNLDNGVVFYQNNKLNTTYDSSGNVVKINLDKPIRINFTVPIRNRQTVEVYMEDSSGKDYTIVLYNDNQKIIMLYPPDLDRSAIVFARVQNNTIRNNRLQNNTIVDQDSSICENKESNQKSVIIIGAGLSGLTSAQLLEDKGFSVTILEARNRTGGRTFTDDTIFTWTDASGTTLHIPVDIGASWIHGDEKQPLMYLKNKNNIAVWDDAEMRYIDASGTRLPMEYQKIIENAKETIWEWIETLEEAPVSFPFLNRTTKSTIGEILQDMRSLIINSPYFKKTEEEQDIPDNIAVQLGTICYNEVWDRSTDNSGSGLADLGALGFTVGAPVSGKELIVIKGNEQMIKAVSSAETRNKVTLDTEISNIDYSDEDIVTVTDKNNKSYTADYVICTIPVSILKKKPTLFTPPLSEERTSSLDKIGYGLLTKLFMLFPYVFWSSEEKLVILPSTPTQYTYFPNVELAKSNPETITPTIINEWLSNLENTQVTLVNFSKVTTNYGSVPMLVATFPADLGWITERIYQYDLDTSGSRLSDMIHNRLKNAFSSWWENNIPDHSPLPTTIPKPTKVHCTQWSTDPFSYGAYSYIATGGSAEDVDIFQTPLGNNQVFFAGEHTEKKYIATMASAFISGYTAVNKILEDNDIPLLSIPKG